MGKRKYANTQTLTQPDASDRLLTRAEVAEYLNIGTTLSSSSADRANFRATVFQASAFATRKAIATSCLTTALSPAPPKARRKEKSNENSHDKPNFSRRKRIHFRF